MVDYVCSNLERHGEHLPSVPYPIDRPTREFEEDDHGFEKDSNLQELSNDHGEEAGTSGDLDELSNNEQDVHHAVDDSEDESEVIRSVPAPSRVRDDDPPKRRSINFPPPPSRAPPSMHDGGPESDSVPIQAPSRSLPPIPPSR